MEAARPTPASGSVQDSLAPPGDAKGERGFIALGAILCRERRPVRIFKNKPFSRFARKAGVSAIAARNCPSEAERGLVDADLGGGVIKQRVARPGEGKSGGFRTIILLRAGERAFFVHGFAKSDQGNIRDDELAAFRVLAAQLLTYSDAEIAAALEAGALKEVTGDD